MLEHIKLYLPIPLSIFVIIQVRKINSYLYNKLNLFWGVGAGRSGGGVYFLSGEMNYHYCALLGR